MQFLPKTLVLLNFWRLPSRKRRVAQAPLWARVPQPSHFNYVLRFWIFYRSTSRHLRSLFRTPTPRKNLVQSGKITCIPCDSGCLFLTVLGKVDFYQKIDVSARQIFETLISGGRSPGTGLRRNWGGGGIPHNIRTMGVAQGFWTIGARGQIPEKMSKYLVFKG